MHVALGLSLIVASLSQAEKGHPRNWRGLATCLHMQRANVSSAHDVLRFIHRHRYMIVPLSNPPTSQQNAPINRNTRHLSGTPQRSSRCPFTIEVVEDEDTVPRFLNRASCRGCDIKHCKPVMYTHQLLFRKCKNYWTWTKKALPVAYVWILD
ncbi:hypothetical protein OS493_032994 [Desmophyllum pertusum]|uniref:Secreted protein n=2 Tax=Desmophyllum pertusum TaxID=174260 RepID=A0A9X0D724_9CNID|nr:hypothetical protein OS493_032994 [Desmophyllum pertusum]